MSERLIWFKLVNSADGKPYKGTTASTVSGSEMLMVDPFRKAVKAEHANKLSFIDAADLQVYKNKNAFNNRNSDEEKEEKLSSSYPLTGLGKTEEEAVVVVVPTTSVAVKPFRPSQQFKLMSAEDSCKRFLTCVAGRLLLYYEFVYQYRSGPVIGDVLRAKNKGECTLARALHYYYTIADDNYKIKEVKNVKGQARTDIHLPYLFSADEWEILRRLNEMFPVKCRAQFCLMSASPSGKAYVVLPEAEFTPRTVACIKSISVKSSLILDPDNLHVVGDESLLWDYIKTI